MDASTAGGDGVALETEHRVFRQYRDELARQREGQFVLVKGDELVGIFSTFDEAYAQGVTQFGQQLFLVKRIARRGRVVRLSSRFTWLDSCLNMPIRAESD